MPLPMACPKCDARLDVPDDVEGKRLRCKTCGEKFVARRGADSVQVAEDRQRSESSSEPDWSAVANRGAYHGPPQRDSKRSRPRYDEDNRPRSRRSRDEDDSDDEQRPRRKAKGLPVLLGLGAIVSMLLLAGGAVGLWWYLDSHAAQDESGRGSASPNPDALAGLDWIDYSAPDGSFTAKFPAAPQVRTQDKNTIYTSDSLNLTFIIVVAEIPGGTVADAANVRSELEAAAAGLIKSVRNGNGRVAWQTDINQQGYPAKEIEIQKPVNRIGTEWLNGKTRIVYAKGKLITISAAQKQKPWLPNRVEAFFAAAKIS